MKKYFWTLLSIGLAIFTSCSDEPNEISATDNVVNESFLIGEWVADYAIDDPLGYRWEILKFQESGQMYFSNYSDKDNIFHDYVSGYYSITDSIVTTNCKLGWDNLHDTNNTDIHVKKINDFEFNADLYRGGNVTSTNRYVKIVDDIEVGHDEVIPNYKKICGNINVLKFKSHNEHIAKVNETTGAIKGVWAGSTYIDIITERGTAVIQITVKTLLDYDYEKYIEYSKDSIPKIFNFTYVHPDGSWIYNYKAGYYPALQRKSGNWDYMMLTFNPVTERTESISLIAREDAWFTNYQMIDYLSERYIEYEEESEVTGKAFINAPKREDATVGITWDTESKHLSFVTLHKREFVEIGREDYMPNYKDLVGDATILSYSSRNKYIATVDYNTGLITGIDSGYTIIDVETDKGVVSVHVTVKTFITQNYETLLGKTRYDIGKFLDKPILSPYYANDNDLIVPFDDDFYFSSQEIESGNWNNMLLKITDRWSGTITAIVLTAKKNVWFTPEEMSQYLAEKYHSYNKESNDTINAYINDVDEEKATCKILWDISNMKLTFQMIEHKPLPIYDFGRYMGKTRQEAKAMMQSEYKLDPSRDIEQFLIFQINNNGIKKVEFFINPSDAVQSVTVRLDDDVDKYAITNELKSNYQSSDDGYLSDDGLIIVKYIGLSNLISFTFR